MSHRCLARARCAKCYPADALAPPVRSPTFEQYEKGTSSYPFGMVLYCRSRPVSLLCSELTCTPNRRRLVGPYPRYPPQHPRGLVRLGLPGVHWYVSSAGSWPWTVGADLSPRADEAVPTYMAFFAGKTISAVRAPDT